ncbi:MAG: EthD domain-containing protein [Iamia sp.]
MITLHALLVRRSDLTHQEFLDHWHGTHGPLIRDTPGLAQHLIAYTQHPLTASASGLGLDGFDGITVQTFADWDAFLAFASGPDAHLMNDDMASFLDVEGLRVTLTEDPVAVIGPLTSGAGQP